MACMEDRSDFAAMMAHASSVLVCTRIMTLMPFVNLPCIIEMVIECLMPALEIDPKTNFYVAGHKEEIERVIDGLVRRPTGWLCQVKCSSHAQIKELPNNHWPSLSEAVEQRLMGWRASVKGEKLAALYHFKRCVHLTS